MNTEESGKREKNSGGKTEAHKHNGGHSKKEEKV